MKKIAHIINPIQVPESSDLFVAQPITFETMRMAKAYVEGELQISLLTTQYPEDRSMIPEGFQPTPNLNRSILDLASFRHFRKLPLLKDILDRLFIAEEDADFLIYTNVDIGLQPNFYKAVDEFTNSGYDAFVINRRTIPNHYQSLEEIPLMLAEPGLAHRGWDCFIFKRELYPHFKLHQICVGATRVGLGLLANMVGYGENFKEFKQEHLTFHIGDERNWLNPAFADYDQHNTQQLMLILEEIEREKGPFYKNTIPGSFLYRKRAFGPLYEFWSRNVYLPIGVSETLNRLLGRG